MNRRPLGKAFARFLKEFELGERNFARALLRIEQFREPHRSTLREWLLSQWAEEDIEEALAYAGYRSDVRNQILAALSRLDPDRALEIALESAAERRGEVDLVLAAVAETNPRHAFALALEYGMEPNKHMAVTWVAREPQEALEVIFTEWPGVFNAHHFGRAIEQWPIDEIANHVRWLEHWESLTRTVSTDALQLAALLKMAKTEPGEAFALAEEVRLSWDRKPHLLQTWAESDPSAALRWFEENYDAIPEKSLGRNIGALGSFLEWEDLGTLVADLPAHRRVQGLRLSLRSRPAPLNRLLDYAEEYPEEIEAAGFRHQTWWLERTASLGVDQLLDLAENRSGPLRTELQLSAAKRMLETDPEIAAELFTNSDRAQGFEALLADESLAREIAGRVAAQWIESDSDGFARWLATHPDTKLTDEALSHARRFLSPAFVAAFENTVSSHEGSINP